MEELERGAPPTALDGAAFVRDRLSEDLLVLLQQRPFRRWRIIPRLRSSCWLLFFLGAVIIASPFPDEIGISLLGLSKTRHRVFLPLSYAANFLGILAVGVSATALAKECRKKDRQRALAVWGW